MLEPQTNPGAVRNCKCVSADVVDATTHETPVVKKKIKPTPPAVPAAASSRVTRAANHGTNPAAASPRVTRVANQTTNPAAASS